MPRRYPGRHLLREFDYLVPADERGFGRTKEWILHGQSNPPHRVSYSSRLAPLARTRSDTALECNACPAPWPNRAIRALRKAALCRVILPSTQATSGPTDHHEDDKRDLSRPFPPPAELRNSSIRNLRFQVRIARARDPLAVTNPERDCSWFILTCMPPSRRLGS